MPAGYGLSRSSQPAQSLLSTFHKGKRAPSHQTSPQCSKPTASRKQIKIPDDFAPPMSTDDEDDSDTETVSARKTPAEGKDTQLDLLAHSSGDEKTARGTISKTTWRSKRPTRSTRNEDISDPDGSASSSATKRRRRDAEPVKPKRQKGLQLEDLQPTKLSQGPPNSSSSQSTSAALFGRRHAPAQTFGKKSAEPRKGKVRQPKHSHWKSRKEDKETPASDPEDSTAKEPLKMASDPLDTPDKLNKKPSRRGLQVVDDIDDDLFKSPQNKPGKLKVRRRAGTEELLSTPPKKALQESTSNTRGTSRPKARGKRKIKSPTPEPEPPRPLFKAPALIADHFEADDALDSKDDLPPWSSDAENSDAQEHLSPVVEEPADPPSATCPWCSEPVSASLLADYSKGKTRLTVNLQRRFCQIHKKSTALQAWKDRGYPQIAWEFFPARLDDHHDHLLSIVKDEQPSFFRSVLAKQIEEGKSRALKQEDNLNPGYYGPRGFQLMCDYLVDKFRDQLKERAVLDPVIRGRGSAAFIQSVLVPELGVRLIMEDMDLDEEAAKQMMEESKSLGEIVSEDV